jgi:hypothetical protein
MIRFQPLSCSVPPSWSNKQPRVHYYLMPFSFFTCFAQPQGGSPDMDHSTTYRRLTRMPRSVPCMSLLPTLFFMCSGTALLKVWPEVIPDVTTKWCYFTDFPEVLIRFACTWCRQSVPFSICLLHGYKYLVQGDQHVIGWWMTLSACEPITWRSAQYSVIASFMLQDHGQQQSTGDLYRGWSQTWGYVVCPCMLILLWF